jgi:predicted amidohydrolase
MTATTLDLAVCQYAFAGVSTVETLEDRVRGLFDAAGPADVYVLPELLGYDLTLDVDGVDHQLAPAERDHWHDFLATEAADRDALVVGGSYTVHDGGTLRNRAPIAHPDGTLETYDKQCPVPTERDRGTVPGEAGGPVVKHRGVAIGVLVCYDIEFPEQVRNVVDRGAEVLAVPSLTAGEDGFQRVGRCAAARAVENQCYVAQVPLVGTHPSGEKTGTGRATVYQPCDDVVGADGTGLSLPRDAHAAATQTLDVDALRESRTSASVRPYADRDDLL